MNKVILPKQKAMKKKDRNSRESAYLRRTKMNTPMFCMVELSQMAKYPCRLLKVQTEKEALYKT